MEDAARSTKDKSRPSHANCCVARYAKSCCASYCYVAIAMYHTTSYRKRIRLPHMNGGALGLAVNSDLTACGKC